jgi:hypothetical protein
MTSLWSWFRRWLWLKSEDQLHRVAIPQDKSKYYPLGVEVDWLRARSSGFALKATEESFKHALRLTKRSVTTWRRGEPGTTRAALTSVGPRGKASLLLLPLRKRISGYHAEVPCLD